MPQYANPRGLDSTFSQRFSLHPKLLKHAARARKHRRKLIRNDPALDLTKVNHVFGWAIALVPISACATITMKGFAESVPSKGGEFLDYIVTVIGASVAVIPFVT
jgi:hypothetical protein